MNRDDWAEVLLAILLVVWLVATLSGCGGGDETKAQPRLNCDANREICK